MDNEDKKPEVSGETKTVELTPELQAKLNKIKVEEDGKINKKDKKIGPLIAAIVVLLAISAVAVAFTIAKKNNPPASTQASGSSEEKKDEITSLERTELYKKIAFLNYTNYDSENNTNFLKDGNLRTISFAYTKIPELHQNGNLSAQDKLYTMLYNFRHNEKRFEKIYKSTYPEDSAKAFVAENRLISNLNEFYDAVTVVSSSYVATRYKELYGEEVQPKDTDNVCGGFNYDKLNDLYLAGLNDACGGVDFRTAIIRIYDVKKDENSFNVYVNGATIYSGEDAKGKKVCEVYTKITNLDEENAEVYKKCEMNDKYETSFKLTDEDKDKVQKYLYKFDSDFHFKGIEKL